MSIDQPATTTADRDEPAPWSRPLVVIRPRELGSKLAVAIVAAGLVGIGLGWYGVAGPGGRINGITDLRAQLPWIVSGGMLGLALVVLAASLIVVDALRDVRDQLAGRLDQLAESLERQQRRLAADGSETVVIGPSSYHRGDCRLIVGRRATRHTARAEAVTLGLKPCRVCSPDK